MRDTNPNKLKVQDGESHDDATKRIVNEHLQSYKGALRQEMGEFACISSNLADDPNYDPDPDVEVSVSAANTIPDPGEQSIDDPLVEYAKKARLKHILSKDNPTPQDKRIIGDAMGNQDVVVLDD